MNFARNMYDLNTPLSSLFGILDEARYIQSQWESDSYINSMSFDFAGPLIRYRHDTNVRFEILLRNCMFSRRELELHEIPVYVFNGAEFHYCCWLENLLPVTDPEWLQCDQCNRIDDQIQQAKTPGQLDLNGFLFHSLACGHQICTLCLRECFFQINSDIICASCDHIDLRNTPEEFRPRIRN
jgi:hypothetical protein